MTSVAIESSTTDSSPAFADLASRVADLARLRSGLAKSKALLKERRESFETENAGLIEYITKVQEPIVAAAETAVKAVALSLYNENGEKKLSEGVEVKVFKSYAIDERAALVWAKEKQLCLVPESLDLTAVRKLASVTPLPFVSISEEPKVQISSDLSKLVTGEPR